MNAARPARPACLVAVSLATASLLASCTTAPGAEEDSDAARLFAVPQASSTNTAELTGVWEETNAQASQGVTARARFELRADYIVAATQCKTTNEEVYVGGKVAGSANAALIKVSTALNEQKRVGTTNVACALQLGAGVLPVCAATLAPEQRTTCFSLENGTLSIYATSSASVMHKIAD